MEDKTGWRCGSVEVWGHESDPASPPHLHTSAPPYVFPTSLLNPQSEDELLPLPAPHSPLPIQGTPPPFEELSEIGNQQSAVGNPQAEAQEIIGAAQREAEQIRQRAWEVGYETGYQEAKKAEEELRTTVTSALAALREETEHFLLRLKQGVEEYLSQLEPEVLGLVLAVARKVVKDEIRQNPETVLAIIKDALRRVGVVERIRIRVHPMDLAVARKGKSSFLTVVDGLNHLEIIEDRRVEQGSCLIETDHGTIDARLSTQFEEIERVLKEELERAA